METSLFSAALENQSDKLRGFGGSASVSRNHFSLQPILKEYHQLPYYNAPIANGHTPFFRDFLYRKIDQFLIKFIVDIL
jgi:hypothetical protein